MKDDKKNTTHKRIGCLGWGLRVIGELFALLVLLIILHILHKKNIQESLVGLIGLSLLAFFSFITEYFRGDEMVLYFDHRFTQVLQLLIFLFSLALIFVNKKKRIS